MFSVLLIFSLMGQYPQGIITLSSDITEIVCALGAGDRIIGISGSAKENHFLPERIKGLPSCGGWKGIDMERVVMLSPDLVILEGGGASEEIEKSLKSKRLKTLIIYPGNIYQLCDAILLLSRILGCERKGEEIRTFIMDRIEYIRKSLRNISKPRVYLAGSNPYHTFSKGSVWASLIELAGGINVAGGIPLPWPKISAETLIEWDPNIILIIPDAPYTPEWFIKKGELKCIQAIRDRRVYKLSPYLSWSPRIILALMEMAEYIHPDKDLDIEKEKRKLGKLVSLPY